MRGAKIGGIIGAIAFVGAMAAVFFATCTNVFAKMLGTETYPISGDPTHFDPLAALPEVTAKVGSGAVLTELDAWYVGSDGTMNLNAGYSPAPYTEYTFEIPAKDPPKEMPPIGAGRSEGDVWIQEVTVKVYEPGQMRSVTRMSGGSTTRFSYRNEGMDISRSNPRMGKLGKALEPKPTIKDMWELAQKAGASAEAVARVDYRSSDRSFSISGASVDLRWNEDGKLNENVLSNDIKKRLGIVEH